MTFRPWGLIDWAINLSSTKTWYVLGALGTEERSLTTWKYVKELGLVGEYQLIEVQDVDHPKYKEETTRALEHRRSEFVSNGGDERFITEAGLLLELFAVNQLVDRACCQESVILDVSSFPKRFFFPMLKRLVESPVVKNLLITYTSPSDYIVSEPLYEDIGEWRVLPGFGGSSANDELWIVSVGFLVESVATYMDEHPPDRMKLLIPFPSHLSVLRRTWESVSVLEKKKPANQIEKFRVQPLDMSAAFDRIHSLASHPAKSVAFAPYGPKPTSAAICLYAMQREASVYYAQPTVYHPSYSIGIRDNDPKVAVNGYWIKHDGENLYRLESGT